MKTETCNDKLAVSISHLSIKISVMSMSTIRNGVDVEKLTNVVKSVKEDPKNAQTKFTANTKWVGGAYSKTRIRDFVIECDEPSALLGTNRVPNPVEMILAALGSCLAVGFAFIMQQRLTSI